MSTHQSLGYRPALDGLRAVAVIAVLCFHGGFGWASGGYLGVSTFFTLSGFLITYLLVSETRATGRVAIGQFYARRVRRLMPASVLTLSAVVVMSRLGAFGDVSNLRRDVVGAALQLGNWAQLTSGRSYADLFKTGVSPVEHYWSLAIEEQFYLLWPLVIAGLARVGRSTRTQTVVALFVAFGLAAPWISAVWGTNAAYLSTPARLSEILAGAVLALLVRSRGLEQLPKWLSHTGPLALAAVLTLFVVTPSGRGWAYSGGLALFAVLSAVVVGAALVEGPLRSALEFKGLVKLGTLSYGIYLLHWPIFLVFDEQWPTASPYPMFVAKCMVTLALAAVMNQVVERPIRFGQNLERNVWLSLGALVVVIALAAVALPGASPGFGAVPDTKRKAAEFTPANSALGPVANADGQLLRPLRVMVVGDSTGEVFARALIEWAAENPSRMRVQSYALGGCGIVKGGRFDGLADLTRTECDQTMHRELPRLYGEALPDIVLISITVADTWARRWNEGPLLEPTDPSFRKRITTDYPVFFNAAIDADVPKIVWLRPPVAKSISGSPDPSFVNGSQAFIEAEVRSIANRHPERVEVLDYRRWFEAQGIGDKPALRPDGIHLIRPEADRVSAEFLIPELMTLAGVG